MAAAAYSSLRITGDLTVMAWVNRRSTIVNGQICAKGSSDDYTHMYLFRHDKDGRLRLLGGNPTEDGYGFNAITPSDLVNVGSWACTASVIEGDDIRLYVDGTEYELPDAVSSRQSNDEALYIARRGDGWDSMNGRVDEVQVHGTVRSAAWLQVYHEMTSDPGSWAQASAEEPLHIPQPLQLLGLRYYVPRVGRFWTVDPTRDPLVSYVYAANRPGRLVDRNGLQSEGIDWEAVTGWHKPGGLRDIWEDLKTWVPRPTPRGRVPSPQWRPQDWVPPDWHEPGAADLLPSVLELAHLLRGVVSVPAWVAAWVDNCRKVANRNYELALLDARAVYRAVPGQQRRTLGPGMSDALTHCLGICRISKEAGGLCGLLAAYGHEFLGCLGVQPWQELVMDVHNNRIAMEIANNPGPCPAPHYIDCMAECRKAMGDGRLWWLGPNKNFNVPEMPSWWIDYHERKVAFPWNWRR